MLIANSHLEGLYPHAWMAADGFIGNSIFFLLSGYGITLSLLGRQQTFVQYYVRRILRIYPALWLAEVVFHFLLRGFWKSAGWQDYFGFLVYPTAYGYVRQIMVFYVFFFLLRPWLRAGTLFALMAGLCLPLLGLCVYDVYRHPMEQLQLGQGQRMDLATVFLPDHAAGRISGPAAPEADGDAVAAIAPARNGFCGLCGASNS